MDSRHRPELVLSGQREAEGAVCWWAEVEKIDSGPRPQVAGQLPKAEPLEMRGPRVTALLTPCSGLTVSRAGWLAAPPVLMLGSAVLGDPREGSTTAGRDRRTGRSVSASLGEHHPCLLGAASYLSSILLEFSFPGSSFSL